MSSEQVPKKDGNEFVVLDQWSLDVSNFEESALTVLKHVRPDWAADSVAFRVFTDGITNKLVGCARKTDPSDVVLIRVNGEGTDMIIDRQAEVRTFQLLSAVECSPPLYMLFQNGMAYGFFHGEPLDEDSVRDVTVATLIAKEMVRLHSVDPREQSASERRSFYPVKTQKYLDIIPTSFEDQEKHTKLLQCVPSRSALQTELNEICRRLEELRMPVVFSHNDLLLKNIIHNKDDNTVRFIDYEYAFLNYEAYDIGNHFCEYAGMGEADYTLYPNKDYQMVWLRRYLQFAFVAKGRSVDEVTDLDVERLFVQANVCACAAHFFWGLWALIQAKMSSIDFDFLQYSIVRLNEYFRCKEKFFSLALP
ncbi:ethanolamine kinase 1-like isoform X1 [Babylonia areolata]|uniref:ethanolamine kinase 1-like isoform X1 n=1 Tax=Babylonia areolata TaxID=304850 RepID=UPI003FD5A11D